MLFIKSCLDVHKVFAQTLCCLLSHAGMYTRYLHRLYVVCWVMPQCTQGIYTDFMLFVESCLDVHKVFAQAFCCLLSHASMYTRYLHRLYVVCWVILNIHNVYTQTLLSHASTNTRYLHRLYAVHWVMPQHTQGIYTDFMFIVSCLDVHTVFTLTLCWLLGDALTYTRYLHRLTLFIESCLDIHNVVIGNCYRRHLISISYNMAH